MNTEGILNDTGSVVNSSGSSFDMEEIHTPLYLQEDSLNDDDPMNAHNSENQGNEYEIVMTGGQRGNPLLIDSKGFSYSIKIRGGGNVTRWTCSKRSPPYKCKATISQSGNKFIPGE